MMSNLAEIVPGAETWPRFHRNRSEQFEARFVMVEVQDSPSILLSGMAGSRMPIVVSHGEGRAVFAGIDAQDNAKVALRYVDNSGAIAERYPFNPNGSPDGITGLTTPDGRFTIMMPHPERTFRSVQMSWHPDGIWAAIRRGCVDVPQCPASLGGLRRRSVPPLKVLQRSPPALKRSALPVVRSALQQPDSRQ
jgi:phosphoribosylformylglycinamidine (FGAM) synthase-like amidotransferase family enzyme